MEQSVKRPDGKTARVRQNAWGNWIGYVSGRFDREFGNSIPGYGAEQAAMQWLAEQAGRATFRAVGSGGAVVVETVTGYVRSSDRDYRSILNVDVAEYRTRVGAEPRDDVDILLLGYWTIGGGYEPAVVGAPS